MKDFRFHNAVANRPRYRPLPEELVQQIEWVYRRLGPYLSSNLEQFELAFMRDEHPEIEVAIWCRIAAAWSAFRQKYTKCERQSIEGEKRLVAALIAMSMGVDPVVRLGLDMLTAIRLRSCYQSFIE